MTTDNKIIAICVATFKRPNLLSNCLASIGQIIIPAGYTTILIVVDNDSERSGESSFKESTKTYNMESYYYIEADRGICSARNLLLEKAIEHESDYIAFVDDDELTHKFWLTSLIKGLELYKCDIIAAPVLPISETSAPQEFVKDTKHPSGSTPRNIPAGNVIFNKKLIVKHGLRFDRYFDFIGCEDFDFFDRAIEKGMTSVWVDDAIIFETIVPERTTTKYIIYRHFTGGINVVMRYRRHHSLFSAWLRYLPKAIGKLFGALISLFLSIFFKHRKNFKKFIIKLSNGLGYLSGLSNIVIERYRY